MQKKKKNSLVRKAGRGAKRLTVAAGVGAALGAAAALLFAPESGARFRRDIRKQGKKAADVLARQKTAIEHELHAVIESLPPSTRRSLNLAKSRLAKAVVSAKGALSSSRYHDMVESALRQLEGEGEAMAVHVEKAKKQWKRAYSSIKKHLR